MPSLLDRLGDTLLHFVPVMAMVVSNARHERFIKPQAGAMGLLGQLFFAFSQAGKLDVGAEIYVPHDVPFAWVAAGLGQMFAPMLSNNLQKRNYGLESRMTACCLTATVGN